MSSLGPVATSTKALHAGYETLRHCPSLQAFSGTASATCSTALLSPDTSTLPSLIRPSGSRLAGPCGRAAPVLPFLEEEDDDDDDETAWSEDFDEDVPPPPLGRFAAGVERPADDAPPPPPPPPLPLPTPTPTPAVVMMSLEDPPDVAAAAFSRRLAKSTQEPLQTCRAYVRARVRGVLGVNNG